MNKINGWVNSEHDLEVKYAPIVSLLDGSIYAYEATPYTRHSESKLNLRDLYTWADGSSEVVVIDQQFREAAIRSSPLIIGGAKLFLPVSTQMLCQPRQQHGDLHALIEAAGLRTENVVLVITAGEEELGEAESLKAALRQYRTQGYRIGLSGITPRRSALRRMINLKPDYVQFDVGWVSGTSIDAVEEILLQSMITLARKSKIVLIASGLDREELLTSLLSNGVNYGQGKWIGEGYDHYRDRISYVQNKIRTEVYRRYQGASGALAELTVEVQSFNKDTSVSEISRGFELHPEAQGFVISDNGRPVGLIMKEKLHQMLSGQFGLPLYWNRPVGKIMDTHPMIVDESLPVDQVSQVAMARELDKLYDVIIVTREGLVTGIATIHAILEYVTQTRMTDAQWANPLTGLPGNERISRELIRRLAEGKPFAICYADIDHFKWFNDQYGFHRGDDVIRFTAETLSCIADRQLPESCFVGHIGGDDFIMLYSETDSYEMAEMILQQFTSGIHQFEEHKGPVYDRSGHVVENVTGLSISLSVLHCEDTSGWTPEGLSRKAALLKKKAKRMSGNSFIVETISTRLGFDEEEMNLTFP